MQDNNSSRQPFFSGFCIQTDGLTTKEVARRTGATPAKLHQKRREKGFYQSSQARYVRVKKDNWTEYRTAEGQTAA